MNYDEIVKNYDYLMRLAEVKCDSQADAEDLVGDTILAALAYISKGGIIEYPKTWLANTLYHKYNDILRKKSRSPIITYIDDGFDIPAEEENEGFSPEEAAKIRKELNYLAYISREVLIRHYFGGQSVADIAAGLAIPEGTVKSRLWAGRNQMKKGLEKMETRENYLPGELYLSFGGSSTGGHPAIFTYAEDDLIAKNLLILAYDKPVTVSELSKAIDIPCAYIEPIVRKLVDGELMVQTDNGKVYTDFIITKPQDMLKAFKPQLDFAHRHFEKIWDIVSQMSERISNMAFVGAMDEKAKTELDRYAVLKALQDFQLFGTGRVETPCFPKRKDGGQWSAQAIAIDAGYNMNEYNDSMQYTIHGGHRTSDEYVDGGAGKVRLCEFDTTLYDCPRRYGKAFEYYFKYIVPLLWNIYSEAPLDANSEIPNEFISYIPSLEEYGLLKTENGKLKVAIPVLNRSEYNELSSAIKDAVEKLKAVLGEELSAFVSSMKTPIPKHLTSVPDLFRYSDATNYLVMAIVREAYEKGLHLEGVDYCCPPVVLVYAEKES